MQRQCFYSVKRKKERQEKVKDKCEEETSF